MGSCFSMDGGRLQAVACDTPGAVEILREVDDATQCGEQEGSLEREAGAGSEAVVFCTSG